MKPSHAIGCCLIATALSASWGHAAPVTWTDWVASPSLSSATGELTIGAELVQVDFSATSNARFIQTSTGTDYWTPDAPYLSPLVDNAPTGSDIIALNAGGTVTVDFSQPIVDPLIALVSWNGNVVEFNEPIEIISSGSGYWGGGSYVVNGAGTGFTGSGELHGVIRLPGVHNGFSFTHTSENWHGFTVGVVDVVPEPSAALLSLIPGALLLRRGVTA